MSNIKLFKCRGFNRESIVEIPSFTKLKDKNVKYEFQFSNLKSYLNKQLNIF